MRSLLCDSLQCPRPDGVHGYGQGISSAISTSCLERQTRHPITHLRAGVPRRVGATFACEGVHSEAPRQQRRIQERVLGHLRVRFLPRQCTKSMYRHRSHSLAPSGAPKETLNAYICWALSEIDPSLLKHAEIECTSLCLIATSF